VYSSTHREGTNQETTKYFIDITLKETNKRLGRIGHHQVSPVLPLLSNYIPLPLPLLR